ncbi:MAG: glycosyltransferase family 4 protein [Elusimicrobiota bacterium]
MEPQKKIKVAIVITRLDLGGAQQVAIETAKRIDKNIFEVFLISGLGGKLDSSVRQSLGSNLILNKYIKHPISPYDDFLAIFSLILFFMKNKIDVVHTHSSKAGVLGRVSAFISRVPIIIHTVHGWSFNDLMNPILRQVFIVIEKFLSLTSTRIICVANSDKLKGLSLGIGNVNKYKIIRAGIDLDKWRSTKSTDKIKMELNIPKDEFVVGTIANFKPQKNPMAFIHIVYKVLNRMPNVHFIYVGDGPLRKACEEKVLELNIRPHVHFLGWRDDVNEIAQSFDIFLLTSLYEGLPCVFPQVMSIGKPVVATDVDGASEIVKNNINGFLGSPSDLDFFTNRIEYLLKNPSIRNEFGIAAKNSVNDEWDFSFMVSETVKEYSRL